MKKIVILFFVLIMLCGCSYTNHRWKNIAHRGQHNDVPENTLPAVMDAFDDLSHGVEIDLRRTSDGIIVLSHDKIIRGTIDGEEVEYKISKTTYGKLKQVVLAKSKVYGKIHIATLEEVLILASYNKTELVLHCKIQDEDFLRSVAQMVVNYGLSGKCMYNVVNNFETNIPIILSIDRNAIFHLPYTSYLNSHTYDKYNFSSKKQVAIAVRAYMLNDEMTKRIKKSGYTFYISSVNDYNYKYVLFAKPDYVEYSDNIRISTIDSNLFKRIIKGNSY